jgi:hypothetical protein
MQVITSDVPTIKGRDSSVGVAKSYGLEARGSIPGKGRMFFSTASRRALGHTQPLIQCVADDVSPGIKQQRREADHSPPSSAEVKNGGAVPSLPLTSSWCNA